MNRSLRCGFHVFLAFVTHTHTHVRYGSALYCKMVSYRGDDRRCDLSSRSTIRSRFVIEEERRRDVNKEKNNNKLNILKENNEQKKTRYQLFSLDKLIELHGFFFSLLNDVVDERGVLCARVLFRSFLVALVQRRRPHYSSFLPLR